MQHALLQMLAGRRGHFEMESGYHSDAWFELDRLFAERGRLQPFVSELAERLATHRPEAICGPQTGGAILATMLGHEMNLPAFASERIVPAESSGLFPVRYELSPAAQETLRGRRVAVVDDAISAGSAMRGTLASLDDCGARPLAIGALIVFGDQAGRFASSRGLRLESIVQTSFSMWKPTECPLCQSGIACERVSDASPPAKK